MYTRLKNALGFEGTTLSALPEDVKRTLLSLLNGEVPQTDIRKVIDDAETIPFMWTSLKRKYGYIDTPFAQIPIDDLNKMYVEIAAGARVLTNIMNMLQEDETTRYSYAVAKNKLGFGELKLSQLPTDALQLIEAAMRNKVYGTGPRKRSAFQASRSTCGIPVKLKKLHKDVD
jgi:hypothetical protein